MEAQLADLRARTVDDAAAIAVFSGEARRSQGAVDREG
jgi:hypothetical protein